MRVGRRSFVLVARYTYAPWANPLFYQEGVEELNRQVTLRLYGVGFASNLDFVVGLPIRYLRQRSSDYIPVRFWYFPKNDRDGSLRVSLQSERVYQSKIQTIGEVCGLGRSAS